MSSPPPSSPSLSSPLSLLLPSALFLSPPCPAFVALALFSCFCPLAHVNAAKHRSSSVVAHHCHGVVPILLGALLDLGKGPLSIAMATGISMVMLVALATSLSASFVCCLA
jgi:hypothetical protein